MKLVIGLEMRYEVSYPSGHETKDKQIGGLKVKAATKNSRWCFPAVDDDFHGCVYSKYPADTAQQIPTIIIKYPPLQATNKRYINMLHSYYNGYMKSYKVRRYSPCSSTFLPLHVIKAQGAAIIEIGLLPYTHL
jgi:hypothetical protein